MMKPPATLARVCPRCLSGVQRVQRSFTDRVISVLVPVRRFRCTSALCGWEDRLRRGDLDAADEAPRQVLYAASPSCTRATLRRARPGAD